ncbi:hypothetical protein ABZ208_20515 [Streptomyces sp. NPDC006208]|uniref:COG1470 family protein n=1 Tax=Streptomyces sp. NPDC006208 TaxID=3156734 RepID=UPI0033A5924D
MRAAAVVVLAALLCALGTPATASTGWSVDREYVYLEGAPGTVFEDRFSVTNPEAKPLTLRLRLPHRARATSPWIALAADAVRVPARTRAEIPFTVTVPADAPPGDHPVAITAQGAGREAPVRVSLRISGPRLAALTVEDVTYSDGQIRYSLVNRGNTTLVPRLSVRADGVFGTLLDRPARTLPLSLPPSGRVSLTEKWPDPPALDTVDIRLGVTAPGAAHAESVLSATFVPWRLLSPLLLLLPACALWLYSRRARTPAHHHHRRPARSGA